MCGIAGFLDRRASLSAAASEGIARAMADTLRHRGPDDAGTWIDAEAGVAFGHRRLSIVDLSAAGHQPMLSACGRFVLSYNGELYNHRDLRAQLTSAGTTFKGASDTEVLVEAVASWGLAGALERLNGMYAFALWDRRERTLFLARDRLGIKPLYWGETSSGVVFASELKAFHACPHWHAELDREALAAYLRFAYVPAPLSIYRGVQKLEPGTFAVIPPEPPTRVECYWSLRQIARNGPDLSAATDEATAVAELEHLLADAVKRQVVADVPVGALLSGGIDSSTVTALMQRAGNGTVQTFSIGSASSGYDEAPYAKQVADHLGTNHTELYVTPESALELIPQLPDYYDEPFADSSQLLTYLVSALTREHVTVALSGDGGDELFAGYNRHIWAANGYRRLSRLPTFARHAMARALRAVPATALGRLDNHVRLPEFADKLSKLGTVMAVDDSAIIYQRLVSQITEPSHFLPGVAEPHGLLSDPTVATDFPDLATRMQFLDTMTYLPDDILTKVDRASMAASLEVRVPLLDHRVVAFAWRLPRSLKLRAGKGKWLLRRLLARHVPEELTARPKQGFALPLADWLRGPLREWGEAMLSETRIRDAGLLDAAAVRQLWEAHQSGTRNEQHGLWTILVFQSWHERWA